MVYFRMWLMIVILLRWWTPMNFFDKRRRMVWLNVFVVMLLWNIHWLRSCVEVEY
jgi:hypothetical protein